MSFGKYDQESLLAIAAFDKDHSSEACTLVPEHLFDKYYRELFLAIVHFKKRHKSPPGTTHTLDLVVSLKERAPDQAGFYQAIYESMQLTWEENLNTDFVFSRARKFGRWSRLRNAVGLALDEMQDPHDPEDVKINAAEGHLRNALSATVEVADYGVSTHDTDRMLDSINGEADDHDGFMTGIPELDTVRCQPARGQLLVVEGLYGTGKSFKLLNLASSAAMLSRAQVLFLPLEMKELETCQRLMQMLFGIGRRKESHQYMRFTKDGSGRMLDMDPAVLEIPNMVDAAPGLRGQVEHLRLRPRIVVKAFPSNGCTIDKIRALLDGLRARDGFVPDFLVVDYLRLMHIKEAANLRLELGQLAVELRGLAGEMNMAVATAAQLNRSGAGGQATGFAVSEDASINHTADRVLIYNQTDVEAMHGLARLKVDKNRGDRAGFEVVISQAYAAGQYALDSALMHTDYSDMLDGLDGNS